MLAYVLVKRIHMNLFFSSFEQQQGNSVIISPTDDSPAEQMYLQCSVDVPGQPQPYLAYAPVTIRGNDESRKKKKKRRSQI